MSASRSESAESGAGGDAPVVSRGAGGSSQAAGSAAGAHGRFTRLGLFALCAAVLVLLIGCTLPSYGYTFDEVLGALHKGESILEFWLHGADTRYLDTATRQIEYYDDVGHPDFHRGSRATRLWQFYAFPKTVSALCCRLLRGAMLPIDAHHLAVVLIALIGLWYVYRTGWEEAGPVAAVAAFWIVALHPRMFSELHNDLKDVGVAMMMAAAILTYRRATVTQSVRTLMWAAVLTAMAAASKLNAVFIPVIGLPWLVCWLALNRRQIRRRWVIGFLLVPFVAAGVWACLDPMFIHEPEQFAAFYHFYTNWAGSGSSGWDAVGLRKFLICTPPTFLAFFVVGVGWLAWKRRGFDLLFYGCWFAFPILRVCVPGAHDFDGIRHYMECLAPFAIVVSFGLVALCRTVATLWYAAVARRVAYALGLGALFGPVIYVLALYHPYQTVYYNCLVGGFHDAKRHGYTQGEYWCSSYREMIDWMLTHVPAPGVIDASYGSHVLQYYTDIVGERFTLVHTAEGDAALARGGMLYLIEHADARPQRHRRLLRDRSASPIHVIQRDGRTIASLHAIALPKLGGAFSIAANSRDDDRVRVRHQIGDRRKDGWYVKASDKRAFMIYGPYLEGLEAGEYAVGFELVLEGPPAIRDASALDDPGAIDALVCTLDVYDAAGRTVLAKREVRAADFDQRGTPRLFELSCRVPVGSNLEFRVYHEGRAAYGCRRIDVVANR